ncbi:NAD(P)H-binding protein [Streptomyces sp. A7024]|uniref:NAD(P)H-binding protein n=1 Tax=Streptomyces coryli TaxID=1128680 RepID=A0A6G4TW96_9ACTN|nr:NAD(P)H-binding protein [Streptomyces coryli]NGN63716.1 NAD(P)H-binding protein [Streptomyces coryli]
MYLVTGATGNVGREVVRALLDRGAPVRALTRTGDAAGLPKGAEAVAGDLNDPASLAPALAGVRGVFFLPGYADMPGLLAAAKGAGVERVVQLSGRSAATGDMTNAVTAYMVRTEEAVRAAGLPWTIIRPSAFDANALRWLPQLRAGDVLRLPFAGVPIASIDPYDIGEVAAVALLADGHDGRVYDLSGPEPLLPADQVRILGETLGCELRFEAQPDAEARAEMEAAMPKEYVDAFFRFYVDGDLDESPVLPTVREVTGRDPRTFAQWARAHAGDFAS